MAFQLSPGVNVTEFDLTTIVPSVGTTQGAIAARFAWGPSNTIVTISNENELVETFGKPTGDANAIATWFTAANFLAYGRDLKVVRTSNTVSDRNSTSGNTGVLIANEEDYNANWNYPFTTLSNAGINVITARYAGDAGNGLRIEIFANGANANAFTIWGSNTSINFANQFDSIPLTSGYANTRGGRWDEMHILVIDQKGTFAAPNTVLEKYSYVSKAVDAKNDDGSSNYYVNVINDKSRYIYITNHAETSVGWGNTAQNTTFTSSAIYSYTLQNGASVNTTDADLIIGYDRFKNAEETDISLIITGAASNTVSRHVIDNIVETRKDCVAFISPPYTSVVNRYGREADLSVAFRNDLPSTSYAVMDSGWKYQFDKYSNVYRWVPLNGDIAGLCVRTDQDRDPWYSPAGFNRGQIKNVVKLAWNPDKTDRDTLYKSGINPVVSFPGEGTILYGDKTMLTRPSAFDRINVRRLFIVLEKAIARAAKYSLFEFNDEFTRSQFIGLVEPYLRDVQGRRGIYAYRVVCDTTNNTPEVIDRNEFIGDIYIKPARSINFIQLNFVAVRTGVAFEEIVGRF
jgi:hypothetical protein